MSSLYSRIVCELDNLGITGKELGKRLELKKSPLTDWKNGKSKPTLDQLIKMCDIFAKSADYLIFGTETNCLNPSELDLINSYRKLLPRDQEEILSLIEFKLQRSHNTSGVKSKSSQLPEENGNSFVAM